MNLGKIMDDLTFKNVLLISRKDLDDLLTMAVVLKEKDTSVNDIIRILKYDNSIIIIQELTDKNEVVLRLEMSLESAILFIQKRMETYDKMWDGCGCKIDYYK